MWGGAEANGVEKKMRKRREDALYKKKKREKEQGWVND